MVDILSHLHSNVVQNLLIDHVCFIQKVLFKRRNRQISYYFFNQTHKNSRHISHFQVQSRQLLSHNYEWLKHIAFLSQVLKKKF